MALTLVGVGLAAPHDTIANLWVREIDSIPNVVPLPILSGIITGVPGTQANTYSHGCVLTQVNGTTSLSAQWENVGTYALPAWQRWSTV